MTFELMAPLNSRQNGHYPDYPGNYNHRHEQTYATEFRFSGPPPPHWMNRPQNFPRKNPTKNRTNKLQVSNIASHVPWEDIKELFSTFGNVQTCERGQGKAEDTCTAYLTYEAQDQAQQAYSQLNGYEYEGAALKVDYIMERGPGSRSPRGPNGRPGPRNANFGGNSGFPLRASDFPLRILVLSDMVGAIIGRSGGTIRQITQQSRARVDVHRKENSGAFDKEEMYSVQVITIYGNPDNCSLACQKILEVMQQEANNTNRGEMPLKILAHNNLIGRIIGKSGNTIKRIMENTETKITVSSMQDVNNFNFERVITIKGKLENICKAEQMISAKLRQSYENDLAAMAPSAMMFPGLHPMAMMSTIAPPPPRGPHHPPPPPPGPYGHHMGGYGGPGPYPPPPMAPMMCSPPGGPPPPANMEPMKETVFLYIPNSAVGAIIGTGGSTIRDMISSSGSSIKVAQTNKDEPIDREALRKVTIIGSPESQWKAQYMVFKKVTFESYNGDSNFLKVEIFVPSNQVGRIIGKGGQTVRELQRQTRAVIKLPEESDTDSDETPVHIIGDFYSTQAAQRQIRALVNKSQVGMRRGPPMPPNHQRQVQVN